jgi:hypothetical protein
MLRLRVLLLSLLMLALPLQGYAAAAMALCGLPAQQQQMSGDAGTGPFAAAHDHAEHMAHGDAAQQAGSHDGASHDTATTDTNHDTAHKCATCASCHAAALISAPLPDAFHPLPQARLAEPLDAPVSLAPRALFKPPRG